MQAARPTGGISRYYDAMFLLATMPLVRIAAVIGMWLAAVAELGLVVGLAGDACIDRCEEGVDVWDQFFGDGVGGQLGNHGVDQLAE